MKYSEIIEQFKDICLRQTTIVARKVDLETTTIRNLRQGATPSPLHLAHFIEAGLLKVPMEKLDKKIVDAAHINLHPKEIHDKTELSIGLCYSLINGEASITSRIILNLENAGLI